MCWDIVCVIIWNIIISADVLEIIWMNINGWLMIEDGNGWQLDVDVVVALIF